MKCLVYINLAITAALTTVENKISDVSDLVKRADYDAKLSEMEKNLIITSSCVIHLM